MNLNKLRGKKVLVPKGTEVNTYAKRGKYVTKRKQIVVVNHVMEWDPTIHNGLVPVVCWAGSGGYWCECPVDAVRLVDETSELEMVEESKLCC